MDFFLFAPNDVLKTSSAQRLSEAEWHLSVGCAVQACLRCGISLPSIAKSAETTVEECLLALKFAEGSARLRLEAMVEGWTWKEIVAAMSSLNSDVASKPTTQLR